MDTVRKRVFSGIQPSGNLHIGNYIGALRQWVTHQDKYENYFCIVDLHAITVAQDPAVLKSKIRELAAWYIAAGIDPKKSTIFVQSHNPDHAQLAWILNCFTSIGQLNRMTQYKEKKDKQEFVSVGLFDYPVLMAADILLYGVDLVPVGEDQKQHVELARDLAVRFNAKFEPTFTLPSYMPPLTGARIMSLQHPDKKMSKSDNDLLGTIFLADSDDQIIDKVTRAVTDSGNDIMIDKSRPAISNLATLYLSLTDKTLTDLKNMYDGKGYRTFKQDLAETVVNTLRPIRLTYESTFNSNVIDQILTDGGQQAHTKSSQILKKVSNLVGLG